MARDGSGNYNLPAGQPVVTSTVISSSVHNTFAADVAAALTQSLSKDGQTTPTANLPMGTFRHTGVGDGSARTMYPSIGQIQDGGVVVVGSIAGTGNAITGNLNPAITAYVTGMVLQFKPTAGNTTAATIALNGLTAKAIVKWDGDALVSGDLVTAVPALLVYDGTSFYLMNPQTGWAQLSANNTFTGTNTFAAISATTGAFSGVVSHPVGSAAAPSVTFTGDTNTGISAAVADTLVLSVAGIAELTITAGTTTIGGVVATPVGSAAAPSHTFTGDANTGMSAAVADTLVFSTVGAARLTLTAASVTANTAFLSQSGSAAAPAVAFVSDTGTGAFFSAGLYRLSVAGAEVSRIGAASMNIFSTQLFLPDGTSATVPDLSWSTDANTGFYRPSADEIGFSLGGTGFLVGYRNIPQNIQAGNYTLLLTDSGKHIYHASGAGAADTYTIPANATVAYPIGTVLTFINDDTNTVSIAITTDTMTLAGTTTVGTRSLLENGVATAVKVTNTSWIISGTGLS